MDPNKVFIGQLHAHLQKPDVMQWLWDHGVLFYEVYMYPNKHPVGPAPVQCCFATFGSVDAATACTSLNGVVDPYLTPTAIKASLILCHNMEAFVVSNTQCL